MNTWKDELIQALEDLGGEADISQITSTSWHKRVFSGIE
jgi:hypothetical protein